MGKKIAKKVLLIGWDAADWKVIQPLIAEGKMPTLAKFMDDGVWGNLATLDPPLSPMLWTSIATGKRADKHGILGFIEPTPEGDSVRPVNSTSRKVKAIWNMLNQKGYKSNVIGWWPSHPAEPINGVMVSNFYQQVKGKYGEPWPMDKGTVYPERLEEELAALRVHTGEITGAHIFPFVPKAAEVNQEEDKRISVLAKFLAHASSIHSASTHVMETEEWDFMAIYHDAIDHFCHGFMKFHPPQLPGVPDDMFEKYHDVVKCGYMFHDMMLERLLKLTDDDTTVMIISDHGFHSDHLRPRFLPKEPAAPAHEHSPFGIFAIKGPGIKKNDRVYGASIIDTTPTILSLFGLPVGEDMEGKALIQCYEETIVPDVIPSWEDVTEGDAGMHPADLKEDPWANQEAMNQLVELGYVDAPDEDKTKMVEDAKNESQYYLARTYINGNKPEMAIPILEVLFEKKPDQVRYGLTLASTQLEVRKFKECQLTVDGLRGQPEIKSSYLDYIEGMLYHARNRPRKALELMRKAGADAPDSHQIHTYIGKALNVMQRWDEAEDAFLRALAINEESAVAHHGLALTYLRRKMYDEAVDELLSAVELLYFFPAAHYHLGEALAGMKEYESAAQAFQVAVSMLPGMTRAHKWLVNLYTDQLNDMDKAKQHQDFLEKNIKGTVTIVSGLPRSGTSMMMQMLDKGGMDILTDEKRQADNNNPKGYYEFEHVKGMKSDVSWMPQASGKVVKIIAQLLMNLPPKFEYKIIFMERDMDEVLTSQQVMLGRGDAKAYPMVLANAFKKQLEQSKEWLDRQPNIDVMFVNYADVVNDPQEQAENINGFLGNTLNLEEMVSVVDPTLYRNKTVKS
jgi:predicted AlkP superfamily phosphohydrolase/phosphomutase/tetratricopeptide (TPR) repeat protein